MSAHLHTNTLLEIHVKVQLYIAGMARKKRITRLAMVN